MAAAVARVGPGGLLWLRVNATDTDINRNHYRFEDNSEGSFTVRYLTGPNTDLNIHFFTADELRDVIGESFTEEIHHTLTALHERHLTAASGHSGK